ncbi:anion permease, partial [bacterium]|nr:anion permease [bacterium]
MQEGSKQTGYPSYRKACLALGIPIMLTILLLPTPEQLSVVGHRTLAVAVLMAFWWITEAIPIPATSIIPLVFFPIFGIMNYRDVASNYGDNIVFLFMGGFFLAVMMQKWNLHKRLALRIVSVIGTSSRRLILGFMVATAFISMMISNTSATLLMYPIALAVLLQLSELRTDSDEAVSEAMNLQIALMLGIAYASSVGGIGTLIGTPPNVIFAGAVQSLYPDAPAIEFFQWLIIGIPLVILLLPIIWLCLTRISFPVNQTKIAGGRQYIRKQLVKLGRMHRGEAFTLSIFVLTALGLVFRRDINMGWFTIPGWTSQLGIEQWVSDTTVVLSAALVSFAIPVSLPKGEFLL